jgi:hypothetical protein
VPKLIFRPKNGDIAGGWKERPAEEHYAVAS